MLLIKNIGTLATPHGSTARCGSEQKDITTLHNAAILIDDNGMIAEITADGELPKYSAYTELIDAEGRLVTP